ncbi:MAG TPA: SDR family NAD(P)-dependent oxidoreductase [Terriglobia bacterium]|nr:SDR family NAD(P)-dependent oxidoreductase [Terriglobia bacterium]
MRLKDKVAVITGAGQGIGLSVAECFAREGARLVLNEVNPRTGRRAVERIRALDGQVALVSGDISSSRVARRAVTTAIERFGRLDILVNNAGIAGSSVGDGPVTESKEDAWDKVLRINLKSVFLCCRYAIPEMIKRGGGAVINVSSVLGLVGSARHFKSHAYAASKGGIISLTRAMAAWYACNRVRVNCVSPGLIDTPMAMRVLGKTSALRYVKQHQPLRGGLGTPEEVASAILFLASNEASMITGIVLPVDAGWSAGT